MRSDIQAKACYSSTDTLDQVRPTFVIFGLHVVGLTEIGPSSDAIVQQFNATIHKLVSH